MKIYISGKISGLTEKEYKMNFENAGYRLTQLFPIIEKRYYSIIVNPIDIKPLFGIKKWFFYMISDIWQLSKCTHIAVQKNWIDSKGAFIEVFFAKFIFKQKIIWL